MDGIANHFQTKNALDYNFFAYTTSKFFSAGNKLTTARTDQRRLRCLDPDTNLRSAPQRSRCSRFTQRLLGRTGVRQVNSSSCSSIKAKGGHYENGLS